MKELDHIGIAVSDLAVSIPLFEKLLDTPCYKTETVDNENVKTAFFKTANCKLELLEAVSADSVIAKFITNRGEGLHHLAFEVADIHAEMARLKNKGFRLLSETPRQGADNKLVCFIHPKDTNGVLVEICMSVNAVKLNTQKSE